MHEQRAAHSGAAPRASASVAVVDSREDAPMSAMPLLLPIFKLARSRALPFVPIRPLLAPAAVAPARTGTRTADRHATAGPWRRSAS